MELTYPKHTAPIENNQSEKNRYDSSQGVELELGMIMIFLGLLGLFRPGVMGLSLTIVHCFILVFTGTTAVWSGLTMERRRVFYVALGLGLFYLLNSFLGYLLGVEGPPGVDLLSDEKIQKVAPGFLQLSASDHLMHLIFSVGFFVVAYNARKKTKNINLQRTKWRIYLTYLSTMMALLFLVMVISHYITKAD